MEGLVEEWWEEGLTMPCRVKREKMLHVKFLRLSHAIGCRSAGGKGAQESVPAMFPCLRGYVGIREPFCLWSRKENPKYEEYSHT